MKTPDLDRNYPGYRPRKVIRGAGEDGFDADAVEE
jgi:hypothetical protein